MAETYRVEMSNAFPDLAWDQFLNSVNQGRIEQSSYWARYKQDEGWSGTRLKIFHNDRTVAGCQILSRKMKFFGKIGYITLGPVSAVDHPDCRSYLIEKLKDFCQSDNILALLASPSDQAWSTAFLDQQFQPNYLKKVIEGDLMIDLSPKLDDLFHQIKPKKRQNIRRAAKLGVSVRLGTHDDLTTFFDLMKQTCERRQKAPNPPDLDSLVNLWNLIEPQGHAVLFIAEHEQQPQAALIGFNFSGTLVLWKKGWSGSSKLKVNDLIIWEAMKWAKENGLRLFQDSGINLESVFSEEERAALRLAPPRSSDLFKQSFGGKIHLLPPSCLFITNKLLRLSYPLLAALFKRPEVRRYQVQKQALAKQAQELVARS